MSHYFFLTQLRTKPFTINMSLLNRFIYFLCK